MQQSRGHLSLSVPTYLHSGVQTEQGRQGLSGLEELSGIDGIVMILVGHRDVSKRTFQRREERRWYCHAERVGEAIVRRAPPDKLGSLVVGPIGSRNASALRL